MASSRNTPNENSSANLPTSLPSNNVLRAATAGGNNKKNRTDSSNSGNLFRSGNLLTEATTAQANNDGGEQAKNPETTVRYTSGGVPLFSRYPRPNELALGESSDDGASYEAVMPRNQNSMTSSEDQAPIPSGRAGSPNRSRHSARSAGSQNSLTHASTSRLRGELAEVVNRVMDTRSNASVEGIPVFELYKATRRLKMQSKCLEGLLFALFIVIFAFLVLSLRRTSLAGETTDALLELFVVEEFTVANHSALSEEVPFFQKTFRDIRTEEEFWLWMFGPALKGLYPSLSGSAVIGSIEQASAPILLTLPMNGSQIMLLGGSDTGIVLRQSRVRPDTCDNLSEGVRSAVKIPCYGPWDDDREDQTPFGPANPTVLNSNRTRQAFQFRESGLSNLQGTYVGQSGVLFTSQRNEYGIRGYSLDLPIDNPQVALEAIRELFDNDWIDLATRVVSLEFNTYNPSNQVVTCCKFIIEFGASGHVRPVYRFYAINAGMWAVGTGPYVAAGVAFLVFLVLYSLRWLRRLWLSPQKRRFLQRWVVVIDIIVLVLFWTSTGLYIAHTISSDVLRVSAFEETIKSARYYPHLFQEAEELHDLDVICSINLVFATIKLISFLPFRTTRAIWSTMGAAAKDIVILGIVMLLFWAGFSLGSHLTFGSLGFLDFQRLERTFGTLMVLMFSGDLNFNELRDVSFYSAPLFYGIYMIFMWGIMLNLFVAIIVLTYERYSDAKSNFDNWSDSRHLTRHGNLVLTIPEKAYQWFHLKASTWYWKRLGKRVAAKGQAFEYIIEAGKGEQFLRDQMKEVMEAMPAERDAVAERLNFPFRRLLKLQVRRVLWRLQAESLHDDVERMRVRVANMYQNLDCDFIRKYRLQIELEGYLDDLERQSKFSLFSSFINMCMPAWKKTTVLHESPTKSSSTGGPGERGQPKSIRSMAKSDSLEDVDGPEDSVALYYSMGEIIRQEREMFEAKLAIERVLRETKLLFDKHNMSFNRLIRHTWNATAESDRTHQLMVAEVEEILGPACLKLKNLKTCPYCNRAAIQYRAKELLRQYRLLRKRYTSSTGNLRRRVRRKFRQSAANISSDYA